MATPDDVVERWACSYCGAGYGIPATKRGSRGVQIACTTCGKAVTLGPGGMKFTDCPADGVNDKGRARAAQLEKQLAGRTITRELLEEVLADVLPPPLDRRTITVFEARWNVKLPADYVEFLCAVANGAPGPIGPICPFGHRGSNDMQELIDDQTLARLVQLFPFCGDDVLDEKAQGARQLGVDPAGALPMGGHPGSEAMLIVTGRCAGQVWVLDQGAFGPAPTELLRPVSFREWYVLWLLN